VQFVFHNISPGGSVPVYIETELVESQLRELFPDIYTCQLLSSFEFPMLQKIGGAYYISKDRKGQKNEAS
jgi:hypothetical protein